MASIKFDGTELLNMTYIPGEFRHESAPGRQITRYPLPRNDGSIFVSSRYGEKRIRISGVLTAASSEALETAMDGFKELFSREQKDLLIDYAGTTRTYVATCERHEFNRRHYDIVSVPWTATFLVGEGVAYGVQETQNYPSFSAYVAPVEKELTTIGSKGPRPKITVTVGAGGWSTAKGVMMRSTDTGEVIMVPINYAWAENDILEIDCRERTVRSDINSGSLMQDQRFYGVFPKFAVGLNTLEFMWGSLPIQETPVNDPTDCAFLKTIASASDYIAESFELPQDEDTVQSVRMIVNKIGSPTAGLLITIETDDANKPSGVLAHVNATINNFSTAITGTQAWKIALFAALAELEANTRYWLVVKPVGGTINGGNYYQFFHPPELNPYTRGCAARSADSGSSWTLFDGTGGQDDLDFAFKIDAGGNGVSSAAAVVDIEYDPEYI